jgi:hypothetical protein
VSSRKGTKTVVEDGRIIKTLSGAAAEAAGLTGAPVTVAQIPALKRLYMESEVSVFLLKLAAKEEDAPPYDISLEKLERGELLARAEKSLEEARGLTSEDPAAALRHARVARDCAATLLHSVNLESRRAKR